MIPIVDCLDSTYEMISASMGAQMGKSEAMLNIFGKMFDDGVRVPALMVQPNEKLTRSFSNDRVEKMVETAEGLSNKLDRSNKNKVTEKFVAGVRWGFAWAGSSTELASHPVGLAICDEVDRMGSNVKGEGDPITLVSARLKNYFNSKHFNFSTPTVEPGSKITQLWYQGTMGKWAWCCPECGEYFIPCEKTLKWPSKATAAIVRKKAYVECPLCKYHIKDIHKPEMNRTGKYIYHTVVDPDADDIVLKVFGFDPPVNTHASFWVSGLCSPWQTMGDIAEKLVTAYRSKDQETIKAALNTYLGETYKIKGEGHDWQELQKLIGEYGDGAVPDGVQVITLGADVQSLGIYYTVRGWGYNQESWKIESGYIPGETEFKPVWDIFSQVIDKDYGGHRIRRAFIDSGYNTSQVYLFTRRFPNLTFAVKGQDFMAKPLTMSKVDLSLHGKILKGGIKLFHVDTDYFKTWLYSRFKWDLTQPGGFHLDKNTTEDYLKQISAEQSVVADNGKKSWIQIRGDNHFLDAETYAAAAGHSLQVHSLKKLKVHDDRIEKVKKKATKRKSFIGAGSGFIGRR